MAYTKTSWKNDQSPYINEANLNKIETGIKDADTLTNNTSKSVATALSKADSALDSAQTANTKANNARTAAENAYSSAIDALTAANNAYTTASNALSTATSALNKANTASGLATESRALANSLEETAGVPNAIYSLGVLIITSGPIQTITEEPEDPGDLLG